MSDLVGNSKDWLSCVAAHMSVTGQVICMTGNVNLSLNCQEAVNFDT